MMKKIFLLMFISVLTLSCSDEIETNTPVIQGSANNQFFRAHPATATINADGSIKLTGTNDARTITLQVASSEVGQYVLGTNPINQATFLAFNQNLYLAGNGIGDGMIEITENEGSSLSGTFYFNAMSGDGDTLNFQKGVFFEVPIANAAGDGEEAGDFLKAEIADAPFDAIVVAATETGGSLKVTGAIQNTSISLEFPTSIAVGDYPLTADGSHTASYAVGSTVETVATGTLVISSNDTNSNTVTGTFEFTTDVSATLITNGSFQFTYQ